MVSKGWGKGRFLLEPCQLDCSQDVLAKENPDSEARTWLQRGKTKVKVPAARALRGAWCSEAGKDHFPLPLQAAAGRDVGAGSDTLPWQDIRGIWISPAPGRPGEIFHLPCSCLAKQHWLRSTLLASLKTHNSRVCLQCGVPTREKKKDPFHGLSPTPEPKLLLNNS